MKCDEVVAVAINSSNISMGCYGTELANMASDSSIIDDNCNTIVSALKCGCHVYDNTRGFMQFQLTINFSAMIVAFISAIYHHDSLLKTVQIIWINFIKDSLDIDSLIIGFLLRHIRLTDPIHIICQHLRQRRL